MGFLAPYLLFGLFLAGIPVVIHLLNRRRFIQVDWAPMKYLKLTIKTNRRRLRLEQWLLLLIRTLVIVLLFLAVARPVVSKDGLGALLAVQNRTSRVLVIDDSLSMSMETSGESALARAKAVASRIVRESGGRNSLTLLASSAPDRPLIRHARLEEPDLALRLIGGVEPSDTAIHWPDVLAAAERHLREAAFPIQEVILVTDLRKPGWESGLAETTEAWTARETRLTIVDVGLEANANPNLVLESLTLETPVPLVGGRLSFAASIRNDGGEAVLAPEAVLTVDDQPRAVTLPDLPAGETARYEFTSEFQTAGSHTIQLDLPRDALARDSRRWLLAEVQNEFNIQLVDGEPGLRPFEGETDFLALAYSLGDEPWRAEQTTDAEWLGRPLAAPDVMVLANVASIPASRVSELEGLVEAGMGLMIFPGEQVHLNAYNEELYKGANGLSPARLEQFRDRPAAGLIPEPLSDSFLMPLAKLTPNAFAQVETRRFVAALLPENDSEDARILARWNNPEQSPALLEKRFGRGRVLLWTTAADRQWSDWPVQPSFVIAMRRAAQAIAPSHSGGNHLIAGETFSYSADADALPQNPTVHAPGSEEAISPIVDVSGKKQSVVSFSGTTVAGVYRLNWRHPATGDLSKAFAVNPDVRESDLTRVDRGQLAEFLNGMEFDLIPYGGEDLEVGASKVDLWKSLIGAMLAFLGFESLLAAWIGRGR